MLDENALLAVAGFDTRPAWTEMQQPAPRFALGKDGSMLRFATLQPPSTRPASRPRRRPR